MFAYFTGEYSLKFLNVCCLIDNVFIVYIFRNAHVETPICQPETVQF